MALFLLKNAKYSIYTKDETLSINPPSNTPNVKSNNSIISPLYPPTSLSSP
jgi:hypothetical protein